jgi:hypothetical protein
MRQAVRNAAVDNFAASEGGSLSRRTLKNYFAIPRENYLKVLKQDRLQMIDLKKQGFRNGEIAEIFSTTAASVANVFTRAKKNGEWNEVDETSEEAFLNSPESLRALADGNAYGEDLKKMSVEKANKKHGIEFLEKKNGSWLDGIK